MPVASLSKHRLPFAFHVPTARLVSPTQTGNGLKCDCICHVCHSRVIAKQGQERIWHFAHYETTDCPATAESAIHAMAKQLIVERQAVYLPGRVLHRTVRGKKNVWSEEISAEIQKAGLFDLKDCVAEKTIFDVNASASYRRPDVMASVDGRALAIEVHNTHAVDIDKAEWLDEQDLSAIEIYVADLAETPADQLLQHMNERLFGPSKNTRWLTHSGDADGETSLDRLEADLRRAKSAQEAELLAQLAALEEKQRKRDEFREKTREIDCLNIALGDGTLHIGLSAIRCTLKVYGSVPDHWFAKVTALARQHGGIFNGRFRTWEFYRDGATKPLFDQLRQAAQKSFFDAVQHRMPPKPSPPSGSSSPPAPVAKRFFDDPALQEAFDERAAIMEFDGGMDREQAERAALEAIHAELTKSQAAAN